MSLFVSSLKKSGHLDQIHMALCHVGSRKLINQDDFASQGWDLFAPRLSIYGFDADADACDQANAELEARQINWNEKHIPLALWKSVGESTLYVTHDPMCSSLYPPNEPYLARFSEVAEFMNLNFTVEIETTTLDDFCKAQKIEEIDFLQTDVQGADLQVLQGASEILSRSILGVKVEVLFSPLYVDSPLFADIDTYLREQGFSLFTLTAASRYRARSPIISTVRNGQILWGDAIYFRDLIQENISPNFKTPEHILKLACIAELMGFPDYTMEILEYLTLNYGTDPQYNFANNIIEGISQFPELVKQGFNSFPIIQRIRDYASGDAADLLENR
ncbi:FkbM family methyltransferase [Microcoleus sp. FACHB-68]|uniref:FkbM family methyltransferase n=1 Tax=Microcoleus sp. FACHB-68 TaxID=2692826 RepID=UPI0016822122|nr:FkbM family methyltransferase [Microcoleus sp. FACHB-68]MBD1937496.1 FkbM family methyltransferase [Microcoleus sp. FACHB-68]